MKLILSLCDHSGTWSQPYQDAGYVVERIDLKRGEDVRLMEYKNTRVHGILAAPPCTMFAVSGARWRAEEKASGIYEMKMIEALSIADACLRAVALYQPQWWCLENPIGTLVQFYGQPVMRFNPCDYAGYADEPQTEAYTKRTCLWGRFQKPVKRAVEPVLGSMMHTQYGGKSERTKAARSVTPTGFARAFFEANQ